MDRFRTIIPLANPGFTIEHASNVYSIGSCFADCMGSRFVNNKFKALSNPFGVVFNPLSVFSLLEAEQLTDLQSGMIENNGLWFHYDLHSEIKAKTREELEILIQQQINLSKAHLLKTDVLIITLGTAIVYKLISKQSTVANCHKMPGNLFEKVLLSADEINESAEKYFKKLFDEKPLLKVIITVSPVRHIKDTLPLNNVSKSTLRLVCHNLEVKFSQIHYFPSFEIMNDELRDYRFYKADMIHPSEVAEEYIWERFGDLFFTEPTKVLLKEWAKLSTAIHHKPFNPHSVAHQQFLKNTIARLESLAKKLNVTEEINLLRNQLI